MTVKSIVINAEINGLYNPDEAYLVSGPQQGELPSSFIVLHHKDIEPLLKGLKALGHETTEDFTATKINCAFKISKESIVHDNKSPKTTPVSLGIDFSNAYEDPQALIAQTIAIGAERYKMDDASKTALVDNPAVAEDGVLFQEKASATLLNDLNTRIDISKIEGVYQRPMNPVVTFSMEAGPAKGSVEETMRAMQAIYPEWAKTHKRRPGAAEPTVTINGMLISNAEVWAATEALMTYIALMGPRVFDQGALNAEVIAKSDFVLAATSLLNTLGTGEATWLSTDDKYDPFTTAVVNNEMTVNGVAVPMAYRKVLCAVLCLFVSMRTDADSFIFSFNKKFDKHWSVLCRLNDQMNAEYKAAMQK